MGRSQVIQRSDVRTSLAAPLSDPGSSWAGELAWLCVSRSSLSFKRNTIYMSQMFIVFIHDMTIYLCETKYIQKYAIQAIHVTTYHSDSQSTWRKRLRVICVISQAVTPRSTVRLLPILKAEAESIPTSIKEQLDENVQGSLDNLDTKCHKSHGRWALPRTQITRGSNYERKGSYGIVGQEGVSHVLR